LGVAMLLRRPRRGALIKEGPDVHGVV
jgi:hypothetical protein